MYTAAADDPRVASLLKAAKQALAEMDEVPDNEIAKYRRKSQEYRERIRMAAQAVGRLRFK